MTLRFEAEKETKNTIRFKEISGNTVGTIYVNKETLSNLDYKPGDTLTVKIEIIKGEER